MTPADTERFWKYVTINDGCWEWSASRKPRGYGQFRVGGRLHYSHRVAWIIAHGAIPHGSMVCHRCDNRRCVNPAHLFLGSAQDNTSDMWTKGRARPALGSNCGTAKLTEDSVHTMRLLRGAGWTFTHLAKMFGVHPSTALRAVKGEQWSHVGGLAFPADPLTAEGER